MKPEARPYTEDIGPTDVQVRKAVEMIRRRVPGVRLIYRFGSSVSGETHAGSDVDLALVAQEPLDSVERWELQEELAIALGQKVDLIDLLRASTVLRMQVVTTGELVWSSDDNVRDGFEMYVYSSYARFHEERKGIVDRVLEEGTVLGD